MRLKDGKNGKHVLKIVGTRGLGRAITVALADTAHVVTTNVCPTSLIQQLRKIFMKTLATEEWFSFDKF